MFNRSSASPQLDPALARRSALELSARRHLRSSPAVPASLAAIYALTSVDAIEPSKLQEIRSAVFELPPAVRAADSDLLDGRRAEIEALWREAVATMSYAAQIAAIQGGAVGATLVAALLHRAGHALATRALALAELEQNVQLDAPSTADWLTRNGTAMFDGLAREWKLPERVAQIVRHWQSYGEDAHPAEAHAVYFGHVLAMELLYPEWSSPAAVDAAAAELHLNAETLEWVRGDRDAVLRLISAS